MSWQVTTVNRLFDLIGEDRKHRPHQVHKDGVQIISIAKKIVKGHHGIDCFFLVASHNGRKGVVPKEFNYMSFALGCYEEWLMSRFEMAEYQNIELTHEHQDLLRKVKHDGVWYIETEKLLDGGGLKLQLLHMNLKLVSFYHVHENKHTKWFVMAGCAVSDENFLKPPAQQSLLLAVDHVKYHIKKYK